MRERGDLTAFTVAGDEGATATESVAACICPRLRRQYAIETLPSPAGLEGGPLHDRIIQHSIAFSSATAPFRAAETLDFRPPGQCNAKRGGPPIKSEAAGNSSAQDGRMVTMKIPIKAKAR